ncbi:hypothetical protein BDQ17DRAFT_1304531 [Cyathus striatus]|nr:hypothetical protein BDQ17DRAFT_1304531 [Cyathus striatus]
MDLDIDNDQDSDQNSSTAPVSRPSHDLVGGPFAVIESDPGVFTSLVRRLGAKHVQLVELYDIEPWATDHLKPHGLIFCFMWHKDTHRPADFQDAAAERVWFANQLSDDACATHAILNVLLNCPHIDIGEELRVFKADTEQMSPVMRGLAITNSPIMRQAHNSLARPADIRGALNSIAITTLNAQKKAKTPLKQKQTTKSKPDNKQSKPTKKAKVAEKAASVEEEGGEEATYHFIGYVPAFGKVWELDGLKSGPLEVGELHIAAISTSANDGSSPRPNDDWMDVVRPALRMKMDKYGGSGDEGTNIRFSLLAVVDDMYERASDELELLKRDIMTLERRLGDIPELRENWRAMVDQDLSGSVLNIFDVVNEESLTKGNAFASNFSSQRMERDVKIMNMSVEDLIPAWESCVKNAMRAKTTVDEELTNAMAFNTEHVKRTFDYEPFFKGFIKALQEEGLLETFLELDKGGRKKRKKGNACKKDREIEE